MNYGQATLPDNVDISLPDGTSATPETLRNIYAEICKSYHGVDDFRMKLLGLLPVISLAAVFGIGQQTLFGQNPSPDMFRHLVGFVGTFACIFTLALFTYEIRGILRCHDLIDRGRDIERVLQVRGQFFVCLAAHQGKDSPLWKEKARRFFDAKFSACLIYSTVAAAWLFPTMRFGFDIELQYCIAWAVVTALALGIGTFLFVRALVAA
ncbi:MAG: hypothetical protein ABW292_09075 [Vicinamibacterales bacterium]